MAAIVNLFALRRRSHQRVALDVAVALVHQCGTVGTGLALNISVTGIQVQCDQLALDSLYRSDLPAQLDHAALDAHFVLPIFSTEAKIDARCLVVYRQQIANNSYVLGLEFSYLPEGSRTLVQRFIQERDEEPVD